MTKQYTIESLDAAKHYVAYLIDNGYAFTVACWTDGVHVTVPASADSPRADKGAYATS